MSVLPTATARERLPFWSSVREAYVLTYGNLGYLFRISWAWVALMFPIGVACHFALAKNSSPEAPVFGWDTLLAPPLFWPMLASIAVAWHRKLLADETWPEAWYLRLDSAVASYLGLIILTSFVVFVPAFAAIIWMMQSVEQSALGSVMVATASGLLMLIAGLYLATRLWLALPARALERSQVTLGEAWRASRGNVWRILAGSFLCTALMWAFIVLPILWEIDGPPITRPIAYGTYQTLVEILVTFLAGMPVVSFLSIAYRQLVGGRASIS